VLQLTVLIKRHPDLEAEEFHERWRAHGRVIAGEPTLARHIRRYEQHHRAIKDYDHGDSGLTYDGLALQQFDSMADFLAFLEEPKYSELIRPDELTLLDMANLVVIFTDGPEVFIG
jgi:hypothetical protein